nr:SGNH/GDSL hydrolase family protein [Candidatus Sigynarchaeota archaeon]
MEYSGTNLQPFIYGLPWFGTETDFKLQRFPTSTLPKLPVAVQHLATHPAGGVIRFRAQTKIIAFELNRPPEQSMTAFSQVGQYGIDFYRDGLWMGVLAIREGYQNIWIETDVNQVHEYAVYLPTYSPLEIRTLALEGDYPGVPEDGPEMLPPSPYKVRGRIVVYGSSITQGAFASRVGLAYPARIGRAIDAEVVNLGMAGAGKGEHEVSDLLAKISGVSMYIMDWGANIADPKEVQLIRERYAYMIDKIRKQYPKVPIIYVNPQSLMMESLTPEPKHSFEIIRDTIQKNYENEKKAGKPCAFVEGRDFIRPGDWDCLIDGAHCNDLGFDRYVTALVPVIKQFLKK